MTELSREVERRHNDAIAAANPYTLTARHGEAVQDSPPLPYCPM
jgi:hypothetical protein